MPTAPRPLRQTTQAQTDAANLYANFLNEAKLRIKSIGDIFNSQPPIPAFVKREFCFLQLRMLCELIALGCLTLHGDIDASNTVRLHTTFEASKIINQLSKLHPNFYPHPVNITIIPGDPGEVRMDRLESGFLTKSELVKLWHLCGQVLHRGTMKEITNQLRAPITVDLGEVFAWANKIVLLLRSHHIVLISTEN